MRETRYAVPRSRGRPHVDNDELLAAALERWVASPALDHKTLARAIQATADNPPPGPDRYRAAITLARRLRRELYEIDGETRVLWALFGPRTSFEEVSDRLLTAIAENVADRLWPAIYARSPELFPFYRKGMCTKTPS